MNENSSLRAWDCNGQRRGPDLRVFRARFDRLRNPRTGTELEATILETPQWANVVPLDENGNIILVRQYRFGVREFTLEIPGGIVERDEDPADAARRELREETGYTTAGVEFLGASQPNPAFHDNLCHHFLARDVMRTDAPQLDSGEDVEVLAVPRAEVAAAVRGGRIQNALVVTALARVLDLRVVPES